MQPAHSREAAKDVVAATRSRPSAAAVSVSPLAGLQRLAGNAAVSSMLQRLAGPEEDIQTSPVLDVVGRGGGQPLAPQVRTDMESRLGSDFSNVRVHTDSKAAASAEAVSAQAYTVGNEIVFGSGSYAPESPSGMHTIAHELTHVQQQERGPVSGTDTGTGISISSPTDPFEVEAEGRADTALSMRRSREGEDSLSELSNRAARDVALERAVLGPPTQPPVAALPVSAKDPLAGPTTQRSPGSDSADSQEPMPAPSRAVGDLGPEEQAFMNRTNEANGTVETAAGKFEQWLDSVTIPYATAWKAHTIALKSADQAAKDANTIVLGAVLALLPGGAGGAIGSAMQKLEAGAAIVDGVKDLAKFGLRSGGTVMANDAAMASETQRGTPSDENAPREDSPKPSIGPSPSSNDSGAPQVGADFKRMPTDPMIWQLSCRERVLEEILNPARQFILDWQHKTNSHDPEFDCSFDPVAAIQEQLRLDGVSLLSLSVPSDDLAQAYEQGFLKDWLLSEYAHVMTSHSALSDDKINDQLSAYATRIGYAGFQKDAQAAYSAALEANREQVLENHSLNW
ncbi:hypothetical protein acdb102_22610 [Acidothermaceae bacterium B102]|nr:hypothetical protein acdb102_22610 [Acidothermaceae bacterium B102]